MAAGTRRTDAEAPPIVLSMTLPGSASLGAFQAGSVAALAVAFNELKRRNYPVRLAAIGGSSAGSIVAALFAHALLTGRDVPEFMRAAWVDGVDMSVLRSGGADAPLSFDELRSALADFLGDHRRFPYDVEEPHDHPVTLQVGLTSLLGFEVEVDGDGEAPGLSYVDWVEFELQPGHDPESLLRSDDLPTVLDAVLASASHPVGFRPGVLDRSADRDRYEEHGVQNLPPSAELWYTDGGLVESRPVGRILSTARRLEDSEPEARIHIVVDPRSSGPSGADEWADPDKDHSWLDGVRRSMSIVPTQALHDDLRGVATVNSRLRDLESLLDDLTEQTDLPREELGDRLRTWAGLVGKTDVRIEIVSPCSTDADAGAAEMLAGDFVGAFGGFLERSIRASDFALGWSSTVAWLPGGLERSGLDDDAIDEICDAVSGAWRDDWANPSLDGTGVDQLGPAGRFRLVVLAGQFARVLLNAATPSFGFGEVRRRVESFIGKRGE